MIVVWIILMIVAVALAALGGGLVGWLVMDWWQNRKREQRIREGGHSAKTP